MYGKPHVADTTNAMRCEYLRFAHNIYILWFNVSLDTVEVVMEAMLLQPFILLTDTKQTFSHIAH